MRTNSGSVSTTVSFRRFRVFESIELQPVNEENARVIANDAGEAVNLPKIADRLIKVSLIGTATKMRARSHRV